MTAQAAPATASSQRAPAGDRHIDALRRIARLLRLLTRTFPSAGTHMAVLDGLRGIALLLVVMSHTSLMHLNLVPGLDMSGAGKIGVWLFFVLSSFLLMHQFIELDAKGKLDGRAWANYVVRRILRIYPLYLVYLLFCWLAPIQTYPDNLKPADVLLHLATLAGRAHLWSITVELRYYLLLPVLVVLYLYAMRRSFFAAAAATALAVSARDWLAPAFDRDGLLTYVSIFMIGSFVAVAHHHLSHRAAWKAPATRQVLAVAGLLLFFATVSTTPSIWAWLTGREIAVAYWHQSFTLFGLLWGAMLLALVNAAGWAQSLFGALPLRVFGVVSFSAYLWHATLLIHLARIPGLQTGSFPHAVAMLGGILLASIASYLLIERPFLRMRLPPTRLQATSNQAGAAS